MIFMSDAISGTRKSRGRPKGDASSIHLRLPADQLAALDAWIASQHRPVSRPEAIRAVLATGLAIVGAPAQTAHDE
jgi:hypothetical protein